VSEEEQAGCLYHNWSVWLFKMLMMLGSFLVVALAVLALRQRRLEVTSDVVRIHDEIVARKQTLLDQRVEIAKETNPWTLAASLKASGVDTGDALELRQRGGNKLGTNGSGGGAAPAARPAVETDLVAPVIQGNGGGSLNNNTNTNANTSGEGHLNANRPRG
jgi:hypothetical protein